MKSNLIIVLTLCLLSLVAYGLYNAIEFYDETIRSEWSSKAKRNPYFAAEKFMTQRGKEVQSSNNLRDLSSLSKSASLFISHNRQSLSQQRVDELIAWTVDGGHLIVTAFYDSDENASDLLLDAFSVSKQEVSCDCDDNEQSDSNQEKSFSELLRDANKEIKKQLEQKAEDNDKPIPDSELTLLKFDGISEPVRINFGQSYVLQHPTIDDPNGEAYTDMIPFYWASNKAGTQFMQFEVGQGILTVLSDSEIWTSENIGKQDHAYLLSILASGKENLTILYGMQMPSLLTLIGRNAPELLIASALSLLMWLIYNARRFGPIQQENLNPRRSLDEHIQACSKLLWYSDRSQNMIANLRESIYRHLRLSYPEFSGLEQQQQTEWLSHKCQMSEEQIEQAMSANNYTNQDDFYKTVRLAQRIGKKL